MERGLGVLVGVAVMLAACGGDERADACGGMRPALEDCFAGDTFADCGGDPTPQFACPPASPEPTSPTDCRWFTGACVAAGFEVSPCSAGPLCCGSALPSAPYGETAFTTHWGLHPWNAERATALTVDLDGSAPAATGISCPDDPADPLCAATPGTTPYGPLTGLSQDTWYVVFAEEGGFFGLNLIVEVIPSPAGPRARACRVPYSDSKLTPCRASSTTESVCADRGSLSFDADPFAPAAPDVHGAGELWFGASRMQIGF